MPFDKLQRLSPAISFVVGALLIQPASATDDAPRSANWEGGWAGDDTGWYVEARVGYAVPSDSKADSTTTNQSLNLDNGFTGAGALGHDFDGFFRTEFEYAYRDGDLDTVSGVAGAGTLDVTTYMANIIAELESSDSAFTPFVGIGLGAATIDGDGAATIAGDTINEDDTAFAYQGIAGLAYAASQNLSFTGTYTYMAVPEATLATSAGTAVDVDYASHSFLFGLRWSFPVEPTKAGASNTASNAVITPEPDTASEKINAPEPEKIAAAPEQAEGPAQASTEIIREFIVFFDWDAAVLSSEAMQTLADAARYAEQGEVVRITVTGHSDRSGPVTYNMKLAQKRADVVKQALVEAGFPANGIDTMSKGENDPLVATADGVKEPQNRRAVIMLE